MTKDDQVPATKEDLQNLRGDVLQQFKTVDQQFQTLMDYIKNEAEETRQQMEEVREEMRGWKDETKQHFDVIAENIHHDMLKGALNDKVEQHEDRIQRLEQHAGFATV